MDSPSKLPAVKPQPTMQKPDHNRKMLFYMNRFIKLMGLHLTDGRQCPRFRLMNIDPTVKVSNSPDVFTPLLRISKANPDYFSLQDFLSKDKILLFDSDRERCLRFVFRKYAGYGDPLNWNTWTLAKWGVFSKDIGLYEHLSRADVNLLYVKTAGNSAEEIGFPKFVEALKKVGIKCKFDGWLSMDLTPERIEEAYAWVVEQCKKVDDPKKGEFMFQEVLELFRKHSHMLIQIFTFFCERKNGRKKLVNKDGKPFILMYLKEFMMFCSTFGVFPALSVKKLVEVFKLANMGMVADEDMDSLSYCEWLEILCRLATCMYGYKEDQSVLADKDSAIQNPMYDSSPDDVYESFLMWKMQQILARPENLDSYKSEKELMGIFRDPKGNYIGWEHKEREESKMKKHTTFCIDSECTQRLAAKSKPSGELIIKDWQQLTMDNMDYTHPSRKHLVALPVMDARAASMQAAAQARNDRHTNMLRKQHQHVRDIQRDVYQKQRTRRQVLEDRSGVLSPCRSPAPMWDTLKTDEDYTFFDEIVSDPALNPVVPSPYPDYFKTDPMHHNRASLSPSRSPGPGRSPTSQRDGIRSTQPLKVAVSVSEKGRRSPSPEPLASSPSPTGGRVFSRIRPRRSMGSPGLYDKDMEEQHEINRSMESFQQFDIKHRTWLKIINNRGKVVSQSGHMEIKHKVYKHDKKPTEFLDDLGDSSDEEFEQRKKNDSVASEDTSVRSAGRLSDEFGY